MKPSAIALDKAASPKAGETFVLAARAAMRRAAHRVAAENKRLGLPMIVEKPMRAKSPAGKK